MAHAELIRFNRSDVNKTSASDVSCATIPKITLNFDTDGIRGKYGTTQSVEPNPLMEYESIVLKYNYHVDIIVGGELLLNYVQLLDGDHVWLTNQINNTTNGIYTVRSTAWEFYKEVTPNVFIDLGATAIDSIDGNLTRAIVTDYSDVDFTSNGFYSIIYYVINSQGNLVTKIRKVKVTPKAASISPVAGYKITQYDITSESDNNLPLMKFGVNSQPDTKYIEDDEPIKTQSLLGEVKLNNDITQSSTSEISCGRIPKISLTYDIDGVKGKYGSIQSVEPNPSIIYELVFLKYNYHVDIITGGEITLNHIQLIDGDRIWLNGQINPTTNGIYIVRADSWEFYKAITPNIFIDLGATASDSVDGDITRNIITDYSDIDFALNGFYSIIYYIVNSQGNVATKTRKVKVIPQQASISPVPGFKITQYDITSETDAKMALMKFGVNIPMPTFTADDGSEPTVYNIGDNAVYIRRDGTVVFVSHQSMGGYRLVHLGNPIDAFDAVNLQTLDNKINPILGSMSGLLPVKTTVPGRTIENIDIVSSIDFRTVKWLIEIHNTHLNTVHSTEIFFVNTKSGGEFNQFGSIGDGNIDEFSINVLSGVDITLEFNNLSGYVLDVSFIRLKCS